MELIPEQLVKVEDSNYLSNFKYVRLAQAAKEEGNMRSLFLCGLSEETQKRKVEERTVLPQGSRNSSSYTHSTNLGSFPAPSL